MKTKKRRAGTTAAAPAGDARKAGKPGPRWKPDLSGAGRAKYLSLVNSIREAVASGDLADGERLPAQRVLANRLGVNVATITKAISEAGRLGLVVTRPGGGTRVVGARRASTATEEKNGIIDLSINIPPVELVKPILDEVMATLARLRSSEHLFNYAPLGGDGRDRAAGSDWISARGLAPAPDRLIVTQGAHEGLFAAMTAATQPGDVVLCENLNYTGLSRIAELCRVKLQGVATDDGGMQPKALAESCAKHAPKAIVCTPVTLNPTTATQNLERRQAILTVAKRYSVTIIEDDIYGHVAGDATPPLAALWPEGVIYVCGLSKCVAPGLRVGYLSAPERFMSRLRDALVLLSWTAPSLHAAVATEMINSGLAAGCASRHRDEALKRMALAKRILGQSLVAGPAATYHAWLRLPRSWLERDATASFQRHGILVSPAEHFVIGSRDAPAAVRISLGAAADAAVLERALRTIADVLERESTGLNSVV